MLDAHGRVWTFFFEHPNILFRLKTRLLDGRSPYSTIVQVDCGWDFCSALSESGSVYVWWLSEGQLRNLYDERIASLGDRVIPDFNSKDKLLRCDMQILRFDPKILPPLPSSLPRLTPGECLKEKPKLVKIAAMHSHLIGLSNEGHVLKFCELHNEYDSDWGYWEYVRFNMYIISGISTSTLHFSLQLPFFSEVDRVRTHPLFCQSSGGRGLIPPESLRITHVGCTQF